MFDIRLPQISPTASEKEQLSQVRSYLYQLAEQLQFGLQNIGTESKESSVVVSPITSRSLAQGSQTPEALFGSIKSLIIKSADIVDEYYEEINKKLVGQYVAQSDFGTFKEETSQDVFENSTYINRVFENTQKIETDVATSIGTLSGDIAAVDSKVNGVETSLTSEIDGLKSELETLNYSMVEVTANIKSGLLDTDDNGIPIYGLEVGQKNIVNGVEAFNKYARFTAGRLSFYDQNGAEVAYISDYKLYITHAEVTGTLKLGGYLVDTTNGLTFKWVGRG